MESPFFASILREKALPADQEALARHYHERGFAVLENLVSEEEARALVAQVAPLAAGRALGPASLQRAAGAVMCGVWVALEDISHDNGPRFYHPGSHRLPEYDLDDFRLAAEPPDYAGYERVIAALMRELEIPREELMVKRGTALIWNSNIVHGGAPIARPGATRHSQVVEDSPALLGAARRVRRCRKRTCL